MFDGVGLILGGEDRLSGQGGRMDISDPSTGKAIAVLPRAGGEEAQEAVRFAVEGFAEWSTRSAFDRYQVLRRAAGLMREKADVAAKTLTLEQGKPLAHARSEWLASADLLDWSAEEGRRVYGRTVPSRSSEISLLVRQNPIGPVGILAPWNFPAWGPMQKLGPALAAGCSCILKPAEETPATAWLMARCLLEAGVSSRAISVIWGNASEIADVMVRAPEIRKISLTGSTRVGRLVAAAAGHHLKKVTMELGGHSAVIVAEDADLDELVPAAVMWKFRNAGQVCVSPTRFIVADNIYDEFVRRFVAAAEAVIVGPGVDRASQMGPMTTQRQLISVDAMVRDAVTKGAKLETGGTRIGTAGNFYSPTVLTGMTPEMQAMNEEPFGPLALIIRVATLDDALHEANRLPVGLGSYAFTRSQKIALKISSELRTGMLGINHFALALPETPFGGVLDSGFGSEGGLEGIQAYLTPMLVTHKHY